MWSERRPWSAFFTSSCDRAILIPATYGANIIEEHHLLSVRLSIWSGIWLRQRREAALRLRTHLHRRLLYQKFEGTWNLFEGKVAVSR